jgi:quercetin dioxygenase-like cupin family protein
MQVQRWNDAEGERMSPLVSRQVLHTGTMTMARLVLGKGAVVPLHHHINEQISTIVAGKLLFEIDGKPITVGAGESVVIPPNVPHRVEAIEDAIALDVFSPAREDWIRGDDAYLRK